MDGDITIKDEIIELNQSFPSDGETDTRTTTTTTSVQKAEVCVKASNVEEPNADTDCNKNVFQKLEESKCTVPLSNENVKDFPAPLMPDIQSKKSENDSATQPIGAPVIGIQVPNVKCDSGASATESQGPNVKCDSSAPATEPQGPNIGCTRIKSEADHFSLRWNNYRTNMTAVVVQLLQNEVFVDVTLSCEGKQLKAHKVVLAACSSYFQDVLQNNPCEHPIIILPRDVAFADLEEIVKFIYMGEIIVAQEQLNSLLEVADYLQIKGFGNVGEYSLEDSSGLTETPLPSSQNVKNIRSVSSKGRTISQGRNHRNHRGRPVGSTKQAMIQGKILRKSTRITNKKLEEEKMAEEEESDLLEGQDPEDHEFADQHNDEPPDAMHNTPTENDPMSCVELEYDSSPSIHEDDQESHQVIEDESQFSSHMVEDHQLPDEDQSELSTNLQDIIDLMGQEEAEEPQMADSFNAESQYYSDSEINNTRMSNGTKLWKNEDMNRALEALRTSSMSLNQTSQAFGIPYTTLWKRAQKMGIEIPKMGPKRTWNESNLACALDELRSGRLSAAAASEEFGIPKSTLYKIIREEGIQLSSTTWASWSQDDLNGAYEVIRAGGSVLKAAQDFGIPIGTLYGRCRREGIVLSKSQHVSWSEEEMNEALDAVTEGKMSVNQASITFNLPYSSLYKRIKRNRNEEELYPVKVEDFIEDFQVDGQIDEQDLHSILPQLQSTLPPLLQEVAPSMSVNTSSSPSLGVDSGASSSPLKKRKKHFASKRRRRGRVIGRKVVE